MKRNTRLLVTLLLVISLVFGVFSVGASAAGALIGGTDESIDTPIDSLDRGWLDITYYDNDIVVTVYPDLSALLDFDREQLSEIKDILFAALRDIVVEEIKNEFFASAHEAAPVLYTLRATAPSYETYKYLWNTGLKNYVIDHFGGEEHTLESAYVGFMESAVNHDAEVDKFVDYVVDLLDTAVKLDVIELESLPTAADVEQLEAIKEEIANVFGEKNEEYVDALTEKLGSEVVANLSDTVAEYAETIVSGYTEKVEELNSATEEELEISISDIIKHIDGIYVDGNMLWGEADGEMGFSMSALRKILAELPRPSEIADMADGDMKLDYMITVHTDYGTSEFGATVALGGGYDTVRALAALVADHVSFEAEDGVISVEVNAPEKLSELLLSALTAPDATLSDELKHKIFALMSATGDDVFELYKSLTFEDIKAVVDAIDFESVFNSEFLKQYIDLSHLTNEEIEKKVDSLRSAIEKLLPYGNRLFELIPERYMDKGLIDLYDGAGSFSGSLNASLDYNDVERVLTKISATWGPTIAAYLHFDTTLDFTLNVSVSTPKINKVEYYYPTETEPFAYGFLPEGAPLAFFADTAVTPDGVAIIGWLDESGALVTEMPNRDTKLVAAITPEITASADVDKTFDGNAATVGVTLGNIPADSTVAYAWTKNGVSIDVTESSFTVFGVADSGEYVCTVTVNGTAYVSSPITVTISKADVDMSGVSFSDLATDFNGELQGIRLQGTLPTGVNVSYSEDKRDAGVYTVTATFTLGEGMENYNCPAPMTAELTINKLTVSLDGISWVYDAFVYDGAEKKVYVKDYSPFLTPVYSGNTATDAGEGYIATVVFEYEQSNITLAGSFVNTLEWAIAKAELDMSGVTFSDLTVDYTGDAFGIRIEGTLPEGVTVSYSADKTQVGVYTVTATFALGEGMDNYNCPAPMTATLTINKNNTNTHYYYDSDGALIIQIDSAEGIPVDRDLVVNNVTALHPGVWLSDDVYVKVLVAYDMFFAKDSTRYPAEDEFTVKMLVPEALRDKTALKIVYINENGEAELLDASRDGDYIVFDTDHFSVYAIAEVAEPPVYTVPTDYTWIWYVVGGVLLVALIVVIIIIIVKRKKKKNGGDDPTEPTDEPTEPTDDAPAEEAPAEEAPVEEAPVEEAPVEEAPAEAPIEETFVEEALVTEEPVKEEPAVVTVTAEEKAPAPAPKAEKTASEEDMVSQAIINGEVVMVRYRSSFTSRLIQSETDIQDYYTVIKNALLSYKGVKARSSWNYESFNKGRVQCAKLNIKGRTLVVYLGLNPEEYSVSKYHFTDVSDKAKFAGVPMMMKIRSDRALRYTVELIDEMMKKLDIPMGDAANEDYHMPYETTEELAKRGLVKVILPDGKTLDDGMSLVKVDVSEHIGKSDKSAEAVEPIHTDAVHADELVTDEEAEASIEHIHTGYHTGKMDTINLDTICENFEDGETVTLEALKEKGLVGATAGRIKVLARGVMTKTLTVIAHRYSLQAVKMITLAGGHAELED
ncbi:MAG: uL15 family ribosomal protein [Clostridia bacterium]|nr:uL15 family ribosomal protein [Clostridia bacterium]